MKNKLITTTSFLILFALIGCTEVKTTETKTQKKEVKVETAEYNLSDKGIPVTITGPTGATVKSQLTEKGREDMDAENYSICKGKFCIDVYMDNNPEEGSSITSYIEDSKMFLDDKIVEKLDNGYITKDSDNSHSFYYVKEKESKFLEFSVGLVFDDLTLEDVKVMIEAVK